eukprot:1000917-Rhodomonas_salina.1
MSSTDIAYAVISLRAAYAMPSTDIADSGTRRERRGAGAGAGWRGRRREEGSGGRRREERERSDR